jgi:O-6-methylguanine DNA methyltransferase
MTTIFTRSRLASPLGALHIVTRGDALVALDFEGFEARMSRLLARRFPQAALEDGPAPARIAEALDRYFAGDLTAPDTLDVSAGGTPFQASVWTALRTIPPGETLGYGRLAARLGHPGASRAVGLANGSNPIAIVVPCHRVIGVSGRLTGYAGGLDRKRFLLSHEGASFAG